MSSSAECAEFRFAVLHAAKETLSEETREDVQLRDLVFKRIEEADAAALAAIAVCFGLEERVPQSIVPRDVAKLLPGRRPRATAQLAQHDGALTLFPSPSGPSGFMGGLFGGPVTEPSFQLPVEPLSQTDATDSQTSSLQAIDLERLLESAQSNCLPVHTAVNCYDCQAPFSFWRRGTNCPLCGQVFCGKCAVSPLRPPSGKQIIVCGFCHDKYNEHVATVSRLREASCVSPEPNGDQALLSSLQHRFGKLDCDNVGGEQQVRRLRTLNSDDTSTGGPRNIAGGSRQPSDRLVSYSQQTVTLKQNLPPEEHTLTSLDLSFQALGLNRAEVVDLIEAERPPGEDFHQVEFAELEPPDSSPLDEPLDLMVAEQDGGDSEDGEDLGRPCLRGPVRPRTVWSNLLREAQLPKRGSGASDKGIVQQQRKASIHLTRVVKKMMENSMLDSTWLPEILLISSKVSQQLLSDTAKGDSMDARDYTYVLQIPGSTNEHRYVNGVAFSKHVAHKRMRSSIRSPRVLLLSCSLEYDRVEGRLSSIAPLLSHEQQFLKIKVDKVLALKPDVVLTERSASRFAQDYLLERGVTLVKHVDRDILQRISRSTSAEIFSSVDTLAPWGLGTCSRFSVKLFTLPQNKKIPVMQFDGCKPESGVTIILRSNDPAQLNAASTVLPDAVYCAYNLFLEGYLKAGAYGHVADEVSIPLDTSGLDMDMPSLPNSKEYPTSWMNVSYDMCVPLPDVIKRGGSPQRPSVEAGHTENAVPAEDAEDSVPEEDAGDSVPAEDAGDSVPAEDAGDSVPAEDAGDSVPVDQAADDTENAVSVDQEAEHTAAASVQGSRGAESMEDTVASVEVTVASVQDTITGAAGVEDTVASVEGTGAGVAGVEDIRDDTVSVDDAVAGAGSAEDTEPVAVEAAEDREPMSVASVEVTVRVAEGAAPSLLVAEGDTNEEDLPSRGAVDIPPSAKLSVEVGGGKGWTVVTADAAKKAKAPLPLGAPSPAVVSPPWSTSNMHAHEARRPSDTSHLRAQHIVFLFSSTRYGQKVPCHTPTPQCISFYQESDIPLRTYLLCAFDSAHVCSAEGCNTDMVAHACGYTHYQYHISVTVNRVVPSAHILPFDAAGRIAMWTQCRACEWKSPCVPMSEPAGRYSFGKFLELLCYGDSGEPVCCEHTSERMRLHCFVQNDKVLLFECYEIPILDVAVSLHVPQSEGRREALGRATFDDLDAAADRVYNALCADVENMAREDVEGMAQSLEMERELFKSKLEAVCKTNVLALNPLKRELYITAVTWANNLRSLRGLRREKRDEDTEDGRPSGRTRYSATSKASLESPQDGDEPSHDGRHDPAADIIVVPIGKNGERRWKDAEGMGAARAAEQNPSLFKGMSRLFAGRSKNQSDIDAALNAFMDKRTFQLLNLPSGLNDTVVHVIKEVPCTLIAFSLASFEYAAQMADAMRGYNLPDSVWDEIVALPRDAGHGGMDGGDSRHFASRSPATTPVSTDDFGSAFGTEDGTSADGDGLGGEGSVPGGEGEEDEEEEERSVEQYIEDILLAAGNKSHIKHEVSGAVSGGMRLSCRSYYGPQFHVLRRFYCGDSTSFIESLSLCKTFGATGGKSRATFSLSQDERFIVKNVSRVELLSFLDFAPMYFEYVSKALFHNLPTILAKILGVFRVEIDGHRANFIVQENLCFNRNIVKLFDLKGSSEARYASKGGHTTGLDDNFLEFAWRSPVFLHRPSKDLLYRCIHNDTLFLSKMNVMDYSLLIGIDDDRHELVVGIIDYIRQYTWDKQLESLAKTTVMHNAEAPDVVMPSTYKQRFRSAMMQYFLVVPDKHAKPKRDIKEGLPS